MVRRREWAEMGRGVCKRGVAVGWGGGLYHEIRGVFRGGYWGDGE